MSPGDIVGSWTLVEPAGRGAVGEVWKAAHRELPDRVCAIKFSPQATKLRVEGAALQALDHPNIVRVEDLSTIDGVPYLRTEWVEGAPLRGPVPEAEARRLVAQILDALVYAHGRGIVHGDLKPANILLSDGTVKIADFGYAPPPPIEHSHTRDEAIVGTAGYLAPEVLRGSDPDAQSDLFSLGALVFELVTGKPPSGMTPPSALGASPTWDPFVGRLLAARDLRFKSAAEARAALDGKHESWLAGPMLILGGFLIFFLGAGMPLGAPLRVLAIAPGALILALFWRGARRPLATVLFWGGIFFAWSAARLGPPMIAAGAATALAGALGYLWPKPK